MPIDKNYRVIWRVVGRHGGHDIWSLKSELDVVHGTTVGVHLESCIGCLKCIDACPTHVFEMMKWNSRMVADPIHEPECILCLACEMVCPVDAISVIRSGGSSETLDSLLAPH
ncbi:MAG: 4Fe-4S dicluster domain-containing protein [Candidatus Thorarchaeota archaeon]